MGKIVYGLFSSKISGFYPMVVSVGLGLRHDLDLKSIGGPQRAMNRPGIARWSL